jgi:hypothetical protein
MAAYPPATRLALGACASRLVPNGSGAAMWRPGATRSGFMIPSTVLPLELHGDSVSSPGPLVSIVSNAPTVNANGSLAGA